jgi:hypothetical protein
MTFSVFWRKLFQEDLLGKVLLNKGHTTCGKERFIGPDHRAVTLFWFRVRQLGWNEWWAS